MRKRLFTCLLTSATMFSLALAPAAGAMNDGRGLYGATDDKVVTDAGFILVAFFPIFIFVMSMLQARLDKRKKARMAAAKANLSSPYLRGGW